MTVLSSITQNKISDIAKSAYDQAKKSSTYREARSRLREGFEAVRDNSEATEREKGLANLGLVCGHRASSDQIAAHIRYRMIKTIISPPPSLSDQPHLSSYLGLDLRQGCRTPLQTRIGMEVNPYSNSDLTIAHKERIGDGVCHTYKVTLESGETAVWKPVKGEPADRKRKYIPPKTGAEREAAASYIADWIGCWAPKAVYVTVKEKNSFLHWKKSQEKGALIQWIDGETASELKVEPSDIRQYLPQKYEELSLFDHIIGNTDRHKGNWMIGNGDVIPIDHGYAFPEENLKQSKNYNFADETLPLSEKSKLKLQNLMDHKTEISQTLIPFIGDKAVHAMWERVAKMLETAAASPWWHT